MRRTVSILAAVIATAACGRGELPPDAWEAAAADSGFDVGTDARVNDVGHDAPRDSGLLDTPDAAHDAGPPDTGVIPAASYWLNPSPPDCSRFRDDPPRWAPVSVVETTGEPRWIRGSGEPTLAIVRTWDVPPPTRASLFGPVLTGSGAVIWTWSDWLETGLDYATGDIIHFGSSSPADDSATEPLELNYTRFPRMWLPADDAVYWENGWRGWPLRVPTFRGLEDAPSSSRVGLIRTIRGGGDPPILVGGSRDTWMPAWSPATGDFLLPAWSGVSAESAALVVSGCDGGIRWASSVPLGTTFGAIFVRENGEVLVGTFSSVSVLDGSTGEPLRSATLSLGGPGEHDWVEAYQPGCGLLVRHGAGEWWYWLDADSLEPGPRLDPSDVPVGANGLVSGTPDCGLVAAVSRTVIRFDADGSVRHATPVPTEVVGSSARPIPLADGGIAWLTDPPGYFHITPEGTIAETRLLDPVWVGFASASDAILAPDGTAYFLTDTAGDFRATAVQTGLSPGPYLWPMSGLNWARTNSVLPP